MASPFRMGSKVTWTAKIVKRQAVEVEGRVGYGNVSVCFQQTKQIPPAVAVVKGHCHRYGEAGALSGCDLTTLPDGIGWFDLV